MCYLPSLEQKTSIDHPQPHDGIGGLEIVQPATPAEEEDAEAAQQFGSGGLDDRFLGLDAGVVAGAGAAGGAATFLEVDAGFVVPGGRRIQLHLGQVVLLDVDEVDAVLVVDLRHGEGQRWAHRRFGGAQRRFEVVVAFQRVILRGFLNVLVVVEDRVDVVERRPQDGHTVGNGGVGHVHLLLVGRCVAETLPAQRIDEERRLAEVAIQAVLR